jgi:hypothetical protein
MPAFNLGYGAFERAERRWEELKGLRLPMETAWRDVRDYVAPRSEFSPIERGGPLSPRNIADATAVMASGRLGAVLHGYLFSPFSPFFRARLADRDPRYAERKWLERVERAMHRRLIGARASFRTTMAHTMVNANAFGTAVIWTLEAKRRMPMTSTSAMMDTWIDADPETGLTDTVFRTFELKAWRAAERYGTAELIKLAGKDPDRNVKFLHTVQPNMDGKRGARGPDKPHREQTFDLEHKIEVETEGYDDFPAATLRFFRQEGSPYGHAPGIQVLPWAKLLNGREDTNMRQEELAGEPPLLDMTGGMLDQADRRPGGMTAIDPTKAALWGREPRIPLYPQGDLRGNYERVRDLRALIKEMFYIDWISPREHGTQTATEVNDRRDLRMRAMASTVAGMEHDFQQIADRYYQILERTGEIPEPPESLAGEELVFDFVSPLAEAQRQSEVETLMRGLELVAQASGFDPMAARAVDVVEVTREAWRKLGAGERHLRPDSQMAAERAAEDERAAIAQEAAIAKDGAAAIRDAAQGAASLSNVGA